MKSIRVLGVFGGAFDPPHLGHALLPTYLRSRRLVDRLLVAPVADHPLGKRMSPLAQRLAWTRAAMTPHGDFVDVSDIEARLAHDDPGPSYTVRLLDALAGAHVDWRVRLVIGSDIVQTKQTERWHRWDRIVQHYDPIVVPRAGFAPTSTAALPEVSSTEVRRRLSSGMPADWEALGTMLPAAVVDLLRPVDTTAPVWLVGRGHVAAHAEPWLRARRLPVTLLRGHAVLDAAANLPDGPRPSAVWILVRDGVIERCARALVGNIEADTPVLHAAGALPSRVALAPLAAAGHPVGTLHPICSLRSERPWPSLLGRAAFGVEGDAPARSIALAWIGEQPWLDLQDLDERGRRAYHGACALAANHLSVLQHTAAQTLIVQGHPRDRVDAALAVLLRSALDNLLALGIPAGITGPVARGDSATVQAHLRALDDEAAQLYRVLSDALGRIVARAKGDGSA